MAVVVEHVLLPGEYLHPNVRIAMLDEVAGRGMMSTGPIASGSVVVKACGLKNETTDVGDLLSKLLDGLSSTEARTRREMEHFLKYMLLFCPNPVPREELERQENFRPVLQKLINAYETELSLDDLLCLMVKLGRNGFVMGVFPLCAYFNHSCRPNCAHMFNESSQLYEVHALETLEPGDELTISYLGENKWHLPTDQRRSILHKNYGFQCMCRRCHQASTLCTEGILAAERELECLCCQQCKVTTTNSSRSTLEHLHGEIEELRAHLFDKHGHGTTSEQGGFCYALDPHAGEDLAGYSKCTRCGKENEWDRMDAVTIEVFYGLNSTLEMHDRLEECEKKLVEWSLYARQWFHPSHWLNYKLYASLQAVSKDLAIRTRESNEKTDEYAYHVALHTLCSLHLLAFGTDVVHPRSSVISTIKENAAIAIRTYCDACHIAGDHAGGKRDQLLEAAASIRWQA